MNFNIYEAVVVSNKDDSRSGQFTARISELANADFLVYYTSPFFSQNNGGMVAIPIPGTEIFVIKTDTGEFFYLTTKVKISDSLADNGLKNWKLIEDKYLYTDRNKPQRISFTDEFNSGLTISNRLTPNVMSTKVDLTSRGGKKVSLSDSPEADSVIIRNEHGDGINISSNPTNIHSERAIEIKSKGAQRIVSFESDIEIMVGDGRDINIENFSTGKGAGRNGDKFGNINIRSSHSDISLVVKGDDSKIFLITPKARIQIEADGSILVESQGDIQLKSQGSINMKSNKSIGMEAPRLDITTTGPANVGCGSMSVKSSGTIAMDGARIDLAGNTAQTPTPIQPKNPIKTEYKE